MFHRNLGQMRHDILDLGIRPTALRTAQVIQPGDLVQQIIHDGNNNGHADRIAPNHNDSDNIRVAIHRQIASEISRIALLTCAAR